MSDNRQTYLDGDRSAPACVTTGLTGKRVTMSVRRTPEGWLVTNGKGAIQYVPDRYYEWTPAVDAWEMLCEKPQP